MHKRLSLILLPLLLLGACANPVTGGSASLEGYFKSTYGDGFEVTSSKFTQYDDASKGISFAGTIVNLPSLTQTSGTLIIQITDAGTWGKTVDSYYAIRWKGLSDKGVSQSAAYKSGSAYNNGAATLPLATSEYTEANGYYSYAEYLRQ